MQKKTKPELCLIKKKKERQQETKFSIQEKKKSTTPFKPKLFVCHPQRSLALKKIQEELLCSPVLKKITHSHAGSEVFNRFPSF